MDLSKLQVGKDELIDVPVLFDDEGEPTDGFKVVGANSKRYQEVDRKWKLANVRRVALRRQITNASTEEGAAELVDAVVRREAAIVKACVVELYGFTQDGKPAELTEATLTAIFTARPRWREKVIAAIEADSGFMRA